MDFREVFESVLTAWIFVISGLVLSMVVVGVGLGFLCLLFKIAGIDVF